MSLFDAINFKEAPFLPALNTGTLLDYATGYFIPGANGEMLLNGGMVLTNAAIGRPQMFKSTLAVSHAMLAFARYPGSDMAIYDTERTLQKDRILRMADIPIPESNTLKLSTRAEYYAEEFYEFVRALATYKMKHAKDYMVEIPHLNPKTGKAQRMMRPTFIGIDSWSNMESKSVEDMLNPEVKFGSDGSFSSKSTITSSESNTVFMRDGLAKKKIIKELNALAEKAGLYMFFTAHVGDKIEMNPFAPSMKSLQHMKMSDKPKSVGGDFMFLMMNLTDNRSAKVLINDADKSTLYPSKRYKRSASDLNEVGQVIVRCKGNGSGAHLKSIVSQADGMLPGLTNYHYLKKNGYFGLDGNPMRHSSMFNKDKILTRTTINDSLQADPKLTRAMEILAQLHFVQNTWTATKDTPVDFSISPKVLADKLMSDKSSMNDILESRGWWTYVYDGKKHPQSYMSLFDILAIENNNYVAKIHPVGKVNKLK